jgi:hypothetical protein
MKIEDQVCSFEQAQKLKELGVDIKTIFQWFEFYAPEQEFKVYLWPNDNYELAPCHGHVKASFSAPTVAELGVLLGIALSKTDLYMESSTEDRELTLRPPKSAGTGDQLTFNWFHDGTEATCRADALIWLIEEKFANPEDLKL